MRRREILALLAAVSAAPALAWAPEPVLREREPWGKFAKGPHFRALTAAIAKMKAVTDLANPDGWLFWANIHQSHCPHGKPYFLAWHRGYLRLFEKKLQQLSGVEALRLPYWDYFNDPVVPPEFLDATVGGKPNPLWEARKGSSIAGALTYAAFDKSITRFERGQKDAFEMKIESSPHNNIHNLIGGKMATMQSPQDVLFWLHHANIDRLWTAWLAAGQGRSMPAPTTSYWDARFDYTDTAAMDRRETVGCEHLGYRYADLALPKPLPPAPPPPPPVPRVGAAPPSGGARPVLGALPPATTSVVPGMPQMPGMPNREKPREAFGRNKSLLLSEGAVTVNVALPLASEAAAPPRVGAMPGMAMPEREEEGLTVVLDDVTLSPEGLDGGFFYKVYLDLPGMPSVGREARLLGTIGPFQIATAMTKGSSEGVQLRLPATDLVRRLAKGHSFDGLGQLSVSFVRVDAEDAPDGPVIGIGKFRIEQAGDR